MPEGLHVRRTAGGFLWQVFDGRGARVAGPFGSRAAALAALAELEAPAPAAVCVAPDKQAESEAVVSAEEAAMPGLTPRRRRVLVLARQGMKPVPIAGALGVSRQSVYDALVWLRGAGLLPPAPPRQGGKPGPRPGEHAGKRLGPRENRPSRAGADARPASPRRFRPCITCGKSFPSEGFHNRMCTRCRQGSRDAGPFDVDCSAGALQR